MVVVSYLAGVDEILFLGGITLSAWDAVDSQGYNQRFLSNAFR